MGAEPRVTRPVEPGKELVLGRTGKWHIGDPRVSRTHASVALEDDHLLLRAKSRVFNRASGAELAMPVKAGESAQARSAVHLRCPVCL